MILHFWGIKGDRDCIEEFDDFVSFDLTQSQEKFLNLLNSEKYKISALNSRIISLPSQYLVLKHILLYLELVLQICHRLITITFPLMKIISKLCDQ